MATLVNITKNTPKAIQIWGFHDACTVNDVEKALETISKKMQESNNTIHIMSGTHGYCSGKVGAVATREEKFAEQDRKLVLKNEKVKVKVHDFNNGNVDSKPDIITNVMTLLNKTIKDIVKKNSNSTHTFLLAYCCSAGTR